MDSILGLLIGLGLAASCGFRVFVPLLVMSLAARAGHLALAPGFEWIAGPVALGAFATATILEILAYYVPWFDNLLDTIAGPAAIVAGTLAAASMITDVSPVLRWSVAVIAGGGIAGTIQASTSILRVSSSVTTAGMGNSALATGEAVSAVGTAVLAIALPVVCIVAIVLALALLFRRVGRPLFGRLRSPLTRGAPASKPGPGAAR